MKLQIVHRYTVPLQTAIEQLIGKEATDGEAFHVSVEDDELVVDIIEPAVREVIAQPPSLQPQEEHTPPEPDTNAVNQIPEKPIPGQLQSKGGPLAQRAAIICGERGFWKFLAEHFGAAGIVSADTAADWLRVRCDVKSRTEFDHSERAATLFRPIESKYRMWLEGY
ncbi:MULTISPECIES: hypothetical protein [unclassified Mesorhizobium]|uniref:hypothetical protein n=1 Tax=unclassified Mesorhizobium TaxID=325217 RepID=UPI000FC9A005|nr:MULTISPECIES: hypothetical protein [unclassified Mesorhizobium]RUV18278.1 hypothetical protein EOA91_18320 [Mesorhizobium sp. M1A.F.Ca.IN.022.04.1.1]RWG27085.1 MAG: hypothetical protein EOQ60_26190 [Mesorhizobium sp.]